MRIRQVNTVAETSEEPQGSRNILWAKVDIEVLGVTLDACVVRKRERTTHEKRNVRTRQLEQCVDVKRPREVVGVGGCCGWRTARHMPSPRNRMGAGRRASGVMAV